MADATFGLRDTGRDTLRKQAILAAAVDQFGRFGFRGASLRDIARDAGVSLTLLNHHFGDKAHLLFAAADTQRDFMARRADILRDLTRGGPATFTLRELVQAWIRPGFELAAKPGGESYIRLIARIVDDPSEECVQVVGEHLESVSLAFVAALQQCCPRASPIAAASACAWSCAALLDALTGTRRTARLVDAERAPNDDDRAARLASFLLAGIGAALSASQADVVDVQGLLEAAQPA